MDVRLAVEALSRLTLASPARIRTASKAACQCRQLHLPTTPYRQRVSNSRWAQRRDIFASAVRRAPAAGTGASAATATHRSTPDHLAYPPQQSASSQSSPRAGQMPSNDEIASFVEQSFQKDNQSVPRISRVQSPYGQRTSRDPTTSRSRQAQGQASARFPSEAANRRRFDHPLGQNTTNNTYMGRRAGAQAQQSTADMFESAMRRDPFGSGGRPQSSAGFIDAFTTADSPSRTSDQLDGLENLVDIATGSRSSTQMTRPLPKSSLRLGSSVGRSIEIDPTRGVDLIRGIGMLDTRLGANRVRRDLYRQRFHERPGLKRKRLKSERWRKNFKVGFQAVVRRVKYLTKMGW